MINISVIIYIVSNEIYIYEYIGSEVLQCEHPIRISV